MHIRVIIHFEAAKSIAMMNYFHFNPQQKYKIQSSLQVRSLISFSKFSEAGLDLPGGPTSKAGFRNFEDEQETKPVA